MDNKLQVYVTSFSYKRGLPEDPSGNGGGFVFDCRGIHNPGKYEQYKMLTGKDKPVADFLESEQEMALFLSDALSMVSRSIEKYMDRGFTSLMVSFGCTGGQHRSVYSAEQAARLIASKYQVKVRLRHIEQELKARGGVMPGL
jgi:RNase adaptor protein for sRNA GlmZ degradation